MRKRTYNKPEYMRVNRDKNMHSQVYNNVELCNDANNANILDRMVGQRYDEHYEYVCRCGGDRHV